MDPEWDAPANSAVGTGYAPYFNRTFAYGIYYYGIYYYGIYVYGIYFYSSILLQTVYTSP